VTAPARQGSGLPRTAVAVRKMRAADWESVHAIYAAGIATGHATFEHEPPTREAFDAGRLPAHRLVAEAAGLVLGWAAVSPVSPRAAYSGVVEHSIYVAPQARGRGVGRALLAALVASTEAAGIWTIQSSIFPENKASLSLHERLGFRIVGTRERIARMSHGPAAGKWQDTLLLERRSGIAGHG
jgi:L-amino acid N-acyltransferase YncA